MSGMKGCIWIIGCDGDDVRPIFSPKEQAGYDVNKVIDIHQTAQSGPRVLGYENLILHIHSRHSEGI